MKRMMKFTRDQLLQIIPAKPLAWTRTDTGTFKRVYERVSRLNPYTPSKEKFNRMRRQAIRWEMVDGYPETLTMRADTVSAWGAVESLLGWHEFARNCGMEAFYRETEKIIKYNDKIPQQS